MVHTFALEPTPLQDPELTVGTPFTRCPVCEEVFRVVVVAGEDLGEDELGPGGKLHCPLCGVSGSVPVTKGWSEHLEPAPGDVAVPSRPDSETIAVASDLLERVDEAVEEDGWAEDRWDVVNEALRRYLERRIRLRAVEAEFRETVDG